MALDVYTQVWKTAGSFDPGRGSVAAWLVTLARSRAIDRLRSTASRRRLEEAFEQPPEMPALAPSPEQASLLAQQRRQVQGALATLSPEQREAIELAFFSGLTHAGARRAARPASRHGEDTDPFGYGKVAGGFGRPMRHERVTDEIRDQAALHALGLLAAEDARAFEQHLKLCPVCREEARAFAETTAALAVAGPEAPPDPRLRLRLIEWVKPRMEHVVRAAEGEWQAAGFPGVSVKHLHAIPGREETTVLGSHGAGVPLPPAPSCRAGAVLRARGRAADRGPGPARGGLLLRRRRHPACGARQPGRMPIVNYCIAARRSSGLTAPAPSPLI